MKENRVSEVLKALKPHIEHESVLDNDAPVRKCYRYITNRPGQFYYKGALEDDLPSAAGKSKALTAM
jgi:hypothetical protein